MNLDGLVDARPVITSSAIMLKKRLILTSADVLSAWTCKTQAHSLAGMRWIALRQAVVASSRADPLASDATHHDAC